MTPAAARLIPRFIFPVLLITLTTQAGTPKKELIELARRVEKRVSELRGLEVKKKIRFEMTSKEKVRAYLLDTLKQQYEPGEIEAEGLALSALGLIPDTLEYEDFMVSLFEEQAGGYYDPKKDTFYLADWIAPAMQEMIVAHELTHALQDQHFDIDKFVDREKGNSDKVYARVAVVEGGATLVMMSDSMQKSGMQLDFSTLDLDGPLGRIMMSMSASQMPAFANAPRTIQELLMFPYLKGLSFVAYGKKRGDWKRIDQIYSDLPTSTEQIMHPEKYFLLRDPPTEVTLTILDDLVPKDWKLVYEEVLGEFMTYQLLAPLDNRAEERTAAAGWDGDRVRVFRHGDQLAWVQLSVWDFEKDAVEFAGAFAKSVAKRLPAFAQQPLTKEPRMVWKNKGKIILVERHGLWVLIVERFPRAIADRIRKEVFKDQ